MTDLLTSAIGSAAPAAEGLFRSILPWALALIGLAAVGGLVIWMVRRTLQTGEGGTPEGFTLQSLRELHEQGQLSEEEFQRARQAMIGRVGGAKAAKGGPESPNTSSGPEASAVPRSPGVRRDSASPEDSSS